MFQMQVKVGQQVTEERVAARPSASDKRHVQHVQDFWGDPLTAAGSQSADGKAAYV
jgi:hypothetical protein